MIAARLNGIEQATGTRPTGWLSLARSQSFNTPALLAEAGVAYCCDWVNDDLPYRMTTANGPILNLPLSPWAKGPKPHLLRIAPVTLTGRRFAVSGGTRRA